MDTETDEKELGTIVTADPGPRVHFRRSRSALPFMDMLNGRSGEKVVFQRCMSERHGWRYGAKTTTATHRITQRSEARKYY